MQNNRFWLCLLISLFLASPGSAAAKGALRIGVYYYPGWSADLKFSTRSDPWVPILRFPERMPAAGPYSDSDPRVLRRQLDEMKAGGLSFVVFDAYAGPNGAARQEQSEDAYLKVARPDDVKFALMWANHDRFFDSVSDWRVMVHHWISAYLHDSRYLSFAGKPVLFIFSADILKKQAEGFHSSTAALFAWADAQARRDGLPGISFVAGSDPNAIMISSWAKSAGYSAISNYNIGAAVSPQRGVLGFRHLDERYRVAWSKYATSNLPVIVPMTVGWDRSPWGGSANLAEDGSRSTPDEFAAHISAALPYVSSQLTSGSGLGVICCWNEYGEGSVLEPTKQFGDAHLKNLRSRIDKFLMLHP